MNIVRFDKPVVKIIVGIFIGLPFTLLSLAFGFHGLILGYAGIINADLINLAIGLLTLLGFIGIIGAWVRLFININEASSDLIKKTRTMLYCGIFTTIALFIVAFISGKSLESIIYLAPILLGGMVFLAATPNRSNKAPQPTANAAAKLTRYMY